MSVSIGFSTYYVKVRKYVLFCTGVEMGKSENMGVGANSIRGKVLSIATTPHVLSS
jgi:hypothetical protein